MKRRERIDRPVKARSDDIFALSSPREILYLIIPRLGPTLGLIIGVLACSVVAPYWLSVLVFASIIALLALSWEMMATVGLISLGQSLFCGVGGYIGAILSTYYGVPAWVTIPCATVGGAVLTTCLLLPTLRLRGVYFSMVTLVYPFLVVRIMEATKIFGGTEGIAGIAPLGNVWTEAFLPVGAFLLILWSFRRILGTDYGVVLQAIKQYDMAVVRAGISVTALKAQAVFIAGLPGCFAGAYLAHKLQGVGPSSFGLDYSLLPLTAAVLGGAGSFAGSSLGAFIVVMISELMRTLGPLRVVIYSVILTVSILGLPEGIFSFLRRKYEQIERTVEV